MPGTITPESEAKPSPSWMWINPDARTNYLENLLGQNALIPLAKNIEIPNTFSEFEPHRDAEKIFVATLAWAQRFGLEMDSYSHIRMSTDTHTLASYEVAVIMSEIYHLLYWIDDKMANDTRRTLTAEEEHELNPDLLLKSFFVFLEHGILPENPPLPLLAFVDLVSNLQKHADPRWLADFVAELKKHLAIATQNLDTSARGEVWTLEKYIEVRRFVSGMNLMVWLCKLEVISRLGKGSYVTQEEIERYFFGEIIRQLELAVEDIGGLANDVISVEKEASIGTDFNLVLFLFALKELQEELARQQAFHEAIIAACKIINKKMKGFLTQVESFRAQITAQATALEPNNDRQFQRVSAFLVTYVHALTNCICATWNYQMLSDRYKSETSPYEETRVQKPN